MTPVMAVGRAIHGISKHMVRTISNTTNKAIIARRILRKDMETRGQSRISNGGAKTPMIGVKNSNGWVFNFFFLNWIFLDLGKNAK